MNIDEIIIWLGENEYSYNISKEGENFTGYNTGTIIPDSTFKITEGNLGIGTTHPDITFDKKSNNLLLRESVKEAIKLGRPYMNKYDYDAEDKPTQQEWELALILFKIKLDGGK